jgi:hypothetical protein
VHRTNRGERRGSRGRTARAGRNDVEDLAFIALTLLFSALSWAFVRLAERL